MNNMANEMTGTKIKRVLKKGGAKRIRPDIFENISDDLIDEIALSVKTQEDLSEDNIDNNCRNGYSRKTVNTDSGKIEINVPRDRNAEFDPILVQKYKRRLEGIRDVAE